jgi:hypothetical protein
LIANAPFRHTAPEHFQLAECPAISVRNKCPYFHGTLYFTVGSETQKGANLVYSRCLKGCRGEVKIGSQLVRGSNVAARRTADRRNGGGGRHNTTKDK